MSIFAQDLDPGLRPGSVASRFWTVFFLRVRGTRIADTASDTPGQKNSPNQRRIDFSRSTAATFLQSGSRMSILTSRGRHHADDHLVESEYRSVFLKLFPRDRGGAWALPFRFLME